MVSDATIYLVIAAMGFGTVGLISSLALGLYGYFKIVSYREEQLNKRAGLKASASMKASPSAREDESSFMEQIMSLLPLIQQLQGTNKTASQNPPGPS